jgi:hypothetical protein
MPFYAKSRRKGGSEMTAKADFTEEEWNVVREGPAAAGVLVLMAQGGGSFRETWALAKSYAEARKQPGQSQLLDELASEKPDVERHSTREEQESEGLKGLSEAIALLEQKATPEEVEGYRTFVLAVARKVAEAHEEEGQPISAAEQAAIDKVASTIGTPASS